MDPTLIASCVDGVGFVAVVASGCAAGGAQSQSIRLKNRYMRAMAITISAKAAG